MRKELRGKWDSHSPKTNIFWIHYLVSKLIDGVRYNPKRRSRAVLASFKDFQDRVLSFENTTQIVQDGFFSDLVADEVVVNPLALLNLS